MPKRKRGGSLTRHTKSAARSKRARLDLEATKTQEERDERLEHERNRSLTRRKMVNALKISLKSFPITQFSLIVAFRFIAVVMTDASSLRTANLLITGGLFRTTLISS